jgi:hypothetical protein
MLQLSIRRIKPEKEARLREWLSELNARADEVRATFEAETVRAEQAYIIPTGDGPLLVYADVRSSQPPSTQSITNIVL